LTFTQTVTTSVTGSANALTNWVSSMGGENKRMRVFFH